MMHLVYIKKKLGNQTPYNPYLAKMSVSGNVHCTEHEIYKIIHPRWKNYLVSKTLLISSIEPRNYLQTTYKSRDAIKPRNSTCYNT